ncbi:hypothetical protein UFOVP1655_179 [uncultured Caudovirales phage]|uniref:Uncharacterized protein n=1 Tax=uncultured Caudovirales phage TaxID=2100421 RepID=A0A6J5T6I5_9CAUD|nr:hypothetical protein UFOVP1655_179 [uncultured Caudovirales phage]
MSKKLKDFMLEWGTEMHPSLAKYLKSKGLDPRYVSRNQMISHAKTGDFNKWKQDHYNKARLTHGMESVDVEDLDVIEEDITVDKSPIGYTVTNKKTGIVTNHKTRASANRKADKGDNAYGGYIHKVDAIYEDKFQDPKAATQTVGMEIESNGKPLSNSTKRIKDIVTYGKKPKFIGTDEKSSFGSNKPKALALVTGGTTETGEPRNDIIIDPSMKLTSGQPDTNKEDRNREKKIAK